jgi:arylsulfatase A-like enzyme
MIQHVYLVSIDALRYDCVPFQKDKHRLKNNRVLHLLNTPTLKKITKKCVNFTQATTAAPYTSASHASIFTGLYPPKHGVRALLNPEDQSLKRNILTLAEVFSSEGFETIYASDEETMTRPLGIDRGFHVYFKNDDDALMRYIEQHKNKKLFIFKHFFDVHDPYLLSGFPKGKKDSTEVIKAIKKYAKLRNIALKEGESIYKQWRAVFGGIKNDYKELLPLYVKGVSKFDKGRFKRFVTSLEKLQEFEDGLFFFFSDHREGRCDSTNPKFFAHGGELFDEVMRVPLSMYHSSLKARNVQHLVSLVDIFPTAVQLALDNTPQMSPKYPLDGISLLNKDGHTYTYAEMWKSNIEHPQDYPTNDNWILCQRVIRTEKSKFILSGRPKKLFEMKDNEISESDIKKLLSCTFSQTKQTHLSSEEIQNRIQSELNDPDLRLTKYTNLSHDPDEKAFFDLIKQKQTIWTSLLRTYFLNLIFTVDKQYKQIINPNIAKISPYLALIYSICTNSVKMRMKFFIVKLLLGRHV